jgi:hypothetical protein
MGHPRRERQIEASGLDHLEPVWFCEGKSGTSLPPLSNEQGVEGFEMHTQKQHGSDGRNGACPNLDIEICANSGDVSVSLPRCFRGEITIRASSDRVMFSPALGACTAQLLDIPEERVFFVRNELCEDGRWSNGNSNSNGDSKGQGRSPEEPQDALLIHGEYRNVRLNWIGEEDLPETRLPSRLGIIVPNLKMGAGWKTFWNDVGRLVLPNKVS